jgi:hypothetical protein
MVWRGCLPVDARVCVHGGDGASSPHPRRGAKIVVHDVCDDVRNHPHCHRPDCCGDGVTDPRQVLVLRIR